MKKQKYESVPMPEKKITFKKGSNGTIYVYQTVRAYRNENGKPTSDEVIIGKKCNETGMLIPNDRYIDLYPSVSSTPAPPKRISDYGNTFSLMALAEEIGLTDILSASFPNKWNELLNYAFYMVCEGNVMMYCDDWKETTQLSFDTAMSSQQSSELFSSITYEERMAFFSEWIQSISEQEYLVYDVTSISTYSKGNDLAEWGYNRDEEKLKQINLGMFYGQSSRLPVFYNTYCGSITDKTHLTFMMEHADSLGLSKVMFVMDRGFVTKENLAYMYEEQLPFITCLPAARVDTTKLIDQTRESIRTASNWIAECEMYGTCVDYEIYGIPVKAHIFFDQEKSANEEKELYARLERLETELNKLQKSKKLIKKYTDFFDVTSEGSSEALNFEKNIEKINDKLTRMGYVVFITTDLTCTPTELIEIYRNRDTVEKSFENLKNDLDFKRLKTHTNKTTDGKVFVGFLALILRSCLTGKIKASEKTSKLTIERVLRELRKIKLVTLSDEQNALMPLTSVQKTILNALGIPLEKLQSSVQSP